MNGHQNLSDGWPEALTPLISVSTKWDPVRPGPVVQFPHWLRSKRRRGGVISTPKSNQSIRTRTFILLCFEKKKEEQTPGAWACPNGTGVETQEHLGLGWWRGKRVGRLLYWPLQSVTVNRMAALLPHKALQRGVCMMWLKIILSPQSEQSK